VLDEKIIAAIIKEKKLKEEICETEEYQTALIEKITMIRQILCRHHKVLPQQTSCPTTPVTSSVTETEAIHQTTQSYDSTEKNTVKDGTPTKKPHEGSTKVSTCVQDAHHAHEQPAAGYSTRLTCHNSLETN